MMPFQQPCIGQIWNILNFVSVNNFCCKFPEQVCQIARLWTSFRPLSSSIGLALPVTWGADRTIAARGTGEHGNARLGTKTRRINDDDDDLRSKSSQMIILMDEVDANRNAALIMVSPS